MPSETLHFDNARFAQQLFANDPKNLQAVEDSFGINATARDGWIKLEGPADGIERARQMFQSLELSLKSGSPSRQRDFTHAL